MESSGRRRGAGLPSSIRLTWPWIRFVPPLVIEGLEVDGASMELSNGPIEIPYGHVRFTINYAGLTLYGPVRGSLSIPAGKPRQRLDRGGKSAVPQPTPALPRVAMCFAYRRSIMTAPGIRQGLLCASAWYLPTIGVGGSWCCWRRPSRPSRPRFTCYGCDASSGSSTWFSGSAIAWPGRSTTRSPRTSWE